MSGHSHWSQVRHKKGATDVKRGNLFSKLLRAISIAAKVQPNPEFNPRLRSAIETAKKNQVPQENITRAVSKASETKNLEEVLVEAYGPEGIALLIEAVTDNSNRAISEIKNILSENGAKIAAPGSVTWIFNAPGQRQSLGQEQAGQDEWSAKFQQSVSDTTKEKIAKLIETLENHDDVQKVITNISL